MSRLLLTLKTGRVLLMDGAMGTELLRAGLPVTDCTEKWNMTRPDQVLAIHRAYANAGAACQVTNTFQANPTALARHGLEPKLEEIYQTAIAIARSAAGPARFVFADFGPIPTNLRMDRDLSSAWFKRVLPAASKADGLLFETLSGWMAPHALSFCAELDRPPPFFSFAYKRNESNSLVTEDGLTPEMIADWAENNRIAALGVNCGLEIGMEDIIAIVRRYREHTDLPVFARPNAGTPQRVGQEWIYSGMAEPMSKLLPDLLAAGVRMVGGCCGTTPAHIAAFRPVVEKWNAGLPN